MITNFDEFRKGFAGVLESIPSDFEKLLENFLHVYYEILFRKGFNLKTYQKILHTFFSSVQEQIHNPYQFSLHHKALRSPIDYYELGQDFFRPMIQFDKSKIVNEKYLLEIDAKVQKGENVILLANHQIEADPQMISLMIEKKAPKLAQSLHFVAGERVVTDPLAIPFSLGRNLFCVYSKKYFEFADKEKQASMTQHNHKVIQEIGKSLNRGGLCLYIAASGGRDRKVDDGTVPMAPFDPASIALMELLARKSGKPTHLYGLALHTYDILPPPQSLQVELGESRSTSEAPVFLGFTEELNLDLATDESSSKQEQKLQKCDFVYEKVSMVYKGFF